MKAIPMRSRNGLIAALDIGTTKTTCIIARNDPGGPKVTGFGLYASRGVKAGAVVDMDAAQQSVLQAVHAAEQMAGETIERVLINVSGGHPSSRTVIQDVSLDGHEVTEADMRKALDQARFISEPGEREVLHIVPTGYSIDGSRGIRDPRGMYGQRLGAHLHVVSASTSALRTIAACVARCHLDIDTLVVAPYAAGLATLVQDERELGVTVIDMGGGTTTLAVFYDGHVAYTDSVPIGGLHVTNDIARGLSTPLVHAERLKTLHGAAVVTTSDEREMIDVPLVGEDESLQANPVPKSILTGIIQPRLEETFELVRARLEASGFDHVAGRRVVLTGGASQLAGVRDLAALILDKQVRGGRPIALRGLPEQVSGPAFATCAGLIGYALRPVQEPVRRTRGEATAPSGMFGRLGLWLKENF
jgi:cell division protein FtsA